MSHVRSTKVALAALICAASMAACKAPDASAPDASAKPSGTPAPATVQDPNAIEAPIPADAYKVTLSLSGGPLPSSDGRTITYQVQAKNAGTATVYGVGSKAVNIGISVLGNDNTPNGAGGILDFARARLPLIAPGQSSLVTVVVPADARVAGHSLRLATVQEGVAWHEDDGTIVLGPFQVSDHGTISLQSSKQ